MHAHRLCPWWIGYLLANPLRRLVQSPDEILRPHVRKGMKVLEPGPGMGFFTMPLLRMVGPAGRVVAVDVQPRMIRVLTRRAAKAGLLDRLDARVAKADSMGIGDLDGAADFALAFAMVHEIDNRARFFAEVSRAMKPGARLLLAEPTGHIDAAEFDEELRHAAAARLVEVGRPPVSRSHTALLEKQP